MSDELVHYEVEDGVATLTLDSPANRNALSRQLVTELFEGLDRAEGDDEVKVVLLRSATTNADAAQRMADIFAGQLLPAISKFSPDDAPRRAGLIATQVLGMALCRFVLRLPPVVDLSRDELIEWLGPTLQRYAVG